jgi:hypothetical protein
MPGGEPLWPAPRRPREFRLNADPAETCKSRRLPGTSQRFRSSMAGCKRIRAMGKCFALGNSREPPAETFLGRVDVEAEIREVASHAAKRLPSRRWAIAHHISVPPLSRALRAFTTARSAALSTPGAPVHRIEFHITPLARIRRRGRSALWGTRAGIRKG